MKTKIFSSKAGRFAMLALLAAIPSAMQATPEIGPQGDAETAEFVEMDVNADARLNGSTVDVRISNGIAFLTGKTASLDQAERAMARALAASGVRAVVNQIEIAPFEKGEEALSAELNRRLKEDPSIDGSRIVPVVTGSSVTLNGQAGTWDEQEIAREIASQVPGVTLIDNRIEVTFDSVRSDAQIEAQIRALIADDPLYEGLHLTAAVKDGVVRVNGQVGSRGEYDRLVRRIYVTGVFEVNADKLAINSDLAMEAMGDKHVSPKETLALAKEVLGLDARVNAKEIEVGFEEGVAILRGRVPSLREKAAAEAVVRGVPGVVKVSNELATEGSREMAFVGPKER